MGALEHKIAYSIALLRRAETLALRMSPDGYHLAFSGGKDSVALYHLAKMAGVKFKAHMQITNIDPPELMRFVRSQYPDVVLHRPEINIYKLIEKKKMLPIRTKRYCCAYLKEQAGGGTVTLLVSEPLKVHAEQRGTRCKSAIIAFPAASTNSTAIKSGISRVWEAKIKSCSRQFTAGRIPMYGISFGVIIYPIAGYTTRDTNVSAVSSVRCRRLKTKQETAAVIPA